MIVLDYLLHIAHISVIIINLFFWIFEKTRKLHLIVMCTTLFAWFGIGYFYGFGYCFLTDWHWDVKYSLGETNIPPSYISYWVNNIFKLEIDERVIDIVTVVTFLTVATIATVKNVIIWFKKSET